MATRNPLSTISYNSEKYLLEKLEMWRASHLIQSYMYICHKGEDGDKDHIHLRIEPNKSLDPMNLTESLKEYVGDNPKPLGCRPWRNSKEEDWTLYAVHDLEYLKLKYNGGEKGEKLPYKWQDIKAPDDYDVETTFIRAKAYLEHTSASLVKRIRQGEKPISLLEQGESAFLINGIYRAVAATEINELRGQIDELNYMLTSTREALSRRGIDLAFDTNLQAVLTDFDINDEKEMPDKWKNTL